MTSQIEQAIEASDHSDIKPVMDCNQFAHIYDLYSFDNRSPSGINQASTAIDHMGWEYWKISCVCVYILSLSLLISESFVIRCFTQGTQWASHVKCMHSGLSSVLLQTEGPRSYPSLKWRIHACHLIPCWLQLKLITV